jgi:hypothetical protein
MTVESRQDLDDIDPIRREALHDLVMLIHLWADAYGEELRDEFSVTLSDLGEPRILGRRHVRFLQ